MRIEIIKTKEKTPFIRTESFETVKKRKSCVYLVGAIIDRPPNIFAENIGISAGNKEIIACGNVILYAKSPAGASPRPTMLIENYTKKILL